MSGSDRLTLLTTALAQHGYAVTALPAGRHSASPCGRGPIVAHIYQGGDLVAGLVQIGERLGCVTTKHPAAAACVEAIETAWATPEWESRFGKPIHVPAVIKAPSWRANLSPLTRTYLRGIGAPDPDSSPEAAALIWHHALAVGFSAAYLSQNAAGVAADWPRIPLPATLAALQDSARLGARVAELLDNPQAHTAPELGAVGRLKKVDAAAATAQGYEVRAGWGSVQRGNVVMPGRGRVTERAAEGLPPEVLAELGGERVLDVALNDGWVWENVPLGVWDYTIGGYQVMKKWLSYREFAVLGRSLTLDEAREVSRMARRLAELVMLHGELDANYQRCRADAVSLAGMSAVDAPKVASTSIPRPHNTQVVPAQRPLTPEARRELQDLIDSRQVVVIAGHIKALNSTAGVALARLLTAEAQAVGA